jgi:hypothetical protein
MPYESGWVKVVEVVGAGAAVAVAAVAVAVIAMS